MLSFEYVTKYQVGDKVEIPVAEELLANYNDFYAANLEFYQGRIKQSDVAATENVADADEVDNAQIEKSINEDVKAFETTWGSMDFANATLVGLDINWDALQELLLQEQRKNVRPADSKLIPTAQTLRKVASVLAFSERIVSRLRGKAVDKAMVDVIIQGFEILLQQVHDHNIAIPELNGAENKKIAKLRTVDSIMAYATELFKLGR